MSHEIMKTKTLNIVKKNRAYFKCFDGAYEVKLRITPESENLALGEQDLLVRDVSVRTKYGTDVIYELVGATADVGDKIVTLQHHTYNIWLREACKKLGGRWDQNAWVFSALVEDEVEELDARYNQDCVTVEITATHDISVVCRPVTFLGYVIARAFGRDSGAVKGDNVAQLGGEIYSGGSMKNWRTCVTKNSKFRLLVPRAVLAANPDEDWEVKICGEESAATAHNAATVQCASETNAQ